MNMKMKMERRYEIVHILNQNEQEDNDKYQLSTGSRRERRNGREEEEEEEEEEDEYQASNKWRKEEIHASRRRRRRRRRRKPIIERRREGEGNHQDKAIKGGEIFNPWKQGVEWMKNQFQLKEGWHSIVQINLKKVGI